MQWTAVAAEAGGGGGEQVAPPQKDVRGKHGFCPPSEAWESKIKLDALHDQIPNLT